MPVEDIQVVQGQDVDDFLDRGGVEEMPAHVQHEAPVAEIRPVTDRGGEPCGKTVGSTGRKGFYQGPAAIQDPLDRSSGDMDGLVRDVDPVSAVFPWGG